jgi:phosphatidylglycerophosphatase C
MTARDVRVVLFDLDRTLVRCDSFAGFNRDLLLSAWWRVAIALAAAPLVLPLAAVKRTRLLAASVVAWAGTVGLDDQQLDDRMARYVEARFGGDGIVCRTAIDALRRHHADGDRVLIVTGAPAALARRVCARIGLPIAADIEIVGSSLRPAFGGWIIGEHCFGPTKVRMLAAQGIVRADCVYTDSLFDLPLLRIGARRVLVNASARHRARAASELGEGCEIVTWS